MRQIILDTETTGLEPEKGHRIIEIGCVEVMNRRLTGSRFHRYLNPEREIDQGAIEVHGLTNEFLSDKPLFVDVVDAFMEYVKGAQLVIHNAAFDLGFINHELKMLGAGMGRIEDSCSVLDTLLMAREMHPGQKNSLDALCKRYDVDNSNRDLHGALLDAEILANVYLAMTGGQVTLSLGSDDSESDTGTVREEKVRYLEVPQELRVIRANEQEVSLHEEKLKQIQKQSGQCLWLADS